MPVIHTHTEAEKSIGDGGQLLSDSVMQLYVCGALPLTGGLWLWYADRSILPLLLLDAVL